MSYKKPERFIVPEGIPRDIGSWMQGYWIEKYGNFFDKAKSGDLEPFTLFYTPMLGGRELHEMAHLVQCEDQNLFDPCWGHNQFSISAKDVLSGDTWIAEIEVIVIQTFLKIIITGPRFMSRYRISLSMLEEITGYGKPDDYFRTYLDSAESLAASHSWIGDLPEKEVACLAKGFLNKWTCASIWAEINRKYRLVDEYLESHGEDF